MKKIAYLTIDDAPSKDMREKIDYLLLKKIPAIWFCIGRNIEKNEKDIIYAIKNGFIIGNHSCNHFNFSTIDFDKAKEEIRKTDKLIDLCYKKADIKRPIKLFRFPWGDRGGKNAGRIQEVLGCLEYKALDFKGVTYSFFKKYYKDKSIDIFWTFSVMEYTFLSELDIDKRLKLVKGRLGKEIFQKGGTLTSKSAEVIVIHDHTETIHFFKLIIDRLLEKGIVFKSAILC